MLQTQTQLNLSLNQSDKLNPSLTWSIFRPVNSNSGVQLFSISECISWHICLAGFKVASCLGTPSSTFNFKHSAWVVSSSFLFSDPTSTYIPLCLCPLLPLLRSCWVEWWWYWSLSKSESDVWSLKSSKLWDLVPRLLVLVLYALRKEWEWEVREAGVQERLSIDIALHWSQVNGTLSDSDSWQGFNTQLTANQQLISDLHHAGICSWGSHHSGILLCSLCLNSADKMRAYMLSLGVCTGTHSTKSCPVYPSSSSMTVVVISVTAFPAMPSILLFFAVNCSCSLVSFTASSTSSTSSRRTS